MKQCTPRPILEGSYYNISQCECCQRIGLYYKHLLINFQLSEFESYSKSLIKLPFDQCAVHFPDRQKRIVLNTCHNDIQINLTRNEFQELKDLFQQALIILSANAILKTDQKTNP